MRALRCRERSKKRVRVGVSVLILTLNEEINIGACLESLSWCDDIVVLDSLSTDRTRAIAEAQGVRVVTRAFDNWSAHQNWATAHIEFRHPWVLYLDADERCPPDLRDEVLRCTRPHAQESAFRIRRKDFFMGRWLKHAQLYPTWLVRLFRPDRIRYERLVNPVAVVEGSTGELQAHIIHYPFSHGVSHWIARHNRYSDMEAIEAEKVRSRAVRVHDRLQVRRD
jgi:glycosyltransferase involved in cell wall biosynthesis